MTILFCFSVNLLASPQGKFQQELLKNETAERYVNKYCFLVTKVGTIKTNACNDNTSCLEQNITMIESNKLY